MAYLVIVSDILCIDTLIMLDHLLSMNWAPVLLLSAMPSGDRVLSIDEWQTLKHWHLFMRNRISWPPGVNIPASCA